MADIVTAQAKLAEAQAALAAAQAALGGQAPAPAPAPGATLEVYNAPGGLYVRQAPGGAVVGALHNGDRVRELARSGGWVQHDRGGWSSADYLRPT